MQPAYLNPRTGKTYPLDEPRWQSSDGAPLLLTPLPGMTRSEIDPTVNSLWRYRAALPLEVREPVTMGEGRSPLLACRMVAWARAEAASEPSSSPSRRA